MTILPDSFCGMKKSILTKHGQVSVPAGLRKSMKLHPGQRFISDREFRVTVTADAPPGPMSVLGYAQKIRKGPRRRTSDWMAELREGES
jgi:bifunctional DNA-binding transcriptional regulator/antitoxin component of YhaV-PrlF toxin-antitoxin module